MRCRAGRRPAPGRHGISGAFPAFVRTCAGSIFLVLPVIGCSSIGPAIIPRDRTDYLSSIADSWKEQTLLNVVRLRYGDAPSFLDVSSIIANYAVGGRIHPNLSEVYRSRVSNLAQALQEPGDGTAAFEAVRSLIERVVLHGRADGKGLEIELVGAIAAMVSLSLGKALTPMPANDRDPFAGSVKVVAGAGFEPAAFRL